MSDQLDQAIDRVTAKLVSVEPDTALQDRIVSSLPERSGANWLRLAPQLVAAMGVILFALVLFSNRSNRQIEPIAIRLAPHEPEVAAPVHPVAAVVAGAVMAAKAPAPKSPPALIMDNSFDLEYGLPPVAAPKDLTVTTIDVPWSEVAPIILTDLPSASDSPSPR